MLAESFVTRESLATDLADVIFSHKMNCVLVEKIQFEK